MSLADLYEMIPKGQKNAVSVDDLAMIWSVSRREARRLCEKMFQKDMIVCNLRRGYFRPATLDEIEAEVRFIGAYKKKLETKYYRATKALKTWNQNACAAARAGGKTAATFAAATGTKLIMED